MPDTGDRYARQRSLRHIGDGGQSRLRAGHALVVGCGALGSVAVDQLARAGVGTITVIDRDVVDVGNLQRQTLFDEADAARRAPKAEAAKERIAAVNRDVRVRAFYDDLNPNNAERYADGVDVIVDGLDNLESRYLVNDLAVARGIPYVYGAAVGTVGMLAVIRPGMTPCLRCLFPELPAQGTMETCESVGVLGSVTALVASLEVAQAIKLLVGAGDDCERGLVRVDVWSNKWSRFETDSQRDPTCPCCGQRTFEFLRGSRMARTVTLCGRNAVQIAPHTGQVEIDLAGLERKLLSHGRSERTAEFVRFALREELLELTVFRDGRTVVRGTSDPERARSIVARYVGA